jgi:hypothetical protein
MRLEQEQEPKRYTRHQFMVYRLVMEGTPVFSAVEAVSSTALEHPDWDMDETFTWAEWERLEEEQESG